MLVATGWCRRRQSRATPLPATAIPGVRGAQLDPGLLDRPPEAAGQGGPRRAGASPTQNARCCRRTIPRCTTSQALPPTLDGAQVRGLDRGAVQAARRARSTTQTARKCTPRHDRSAGCRRSTSRTFPTPQRHPLRPGHATRRPAHLPHRAARVQRAGDTDIDRFQESALFPGTPVAIAHRSRDGAWWFVVSDLTPRGSRSGTWPKAARQQVFGYARKTPYLVVTGATARTAIHARRAARVRTAAGHGRARAVAARLAGRRSRSTASSPTPRT